MLYNEKMWQKATASPAPQCGDDITRHPRFYAFLRYCDPVGWYADFYTLDKVSAAVGHEFTVTAYHDIGPQAGWIHSVMTLVPRRLQGGRPACA